MSARRDTTHGTTSTLRRGFVDGHTQIPNATLLRLGRLGGHALAVYAAIVSYAYGKREFYQTMATTAAIAGVSEKIIRAERKRLRDAGLLGFVEQHGRGRATTYTLPMKGARGGMFSSGKGARAGTFSGAEKVPVGAPQEEVIGRPKKYREEGTAPDPSLPRDAARVGAHRADLPAAAEPDVARDADDDRMLADLDAATETLKPREAEMVTGMLRVRATGRSLTRRQRDWLMDSHDERVVGRNRGRRGAGFTFRTGADLEEWQASLRCAPAIPDAASFLGADTSAVGAEPRAAAAPETSAAAGVDTVPTEVR